MDAVEYIAYRKLIGDLSACDITDDLRHPKEYFRRAYNVVSAKEKLLVALDNDRDVETRKDTYIRALEQLRAWRFLIMGQAC